MSCARLSLLVPVSPSWLGAVDTAQVVYPDWEWIHTSWSGGGDRSTETGKSIFSQ